MIRTAYITIHVGSNFGSILQTIATSVVLAKAGTLPTCVNYIPDRVANNRFWQFSGKNIFRNGFQLLWKIYSLPRHLIDSRKYQGYLKKYVRLSEPIYTSDNFVEKCPLAEIYITGSDQVWNSFHNEGLDKRYYFEGIEGTKIALASSFGVESLPDDEYLEVKRMLGCYSNISVREASAKQIVDQMGYQCEQLLDPTFMLDRSEWNSYATKRLVKRPYLLLYAPYNIKDRDVLYNSARTLADSKGLKLVTFSWTYSKEKLADETFRFASPGDFLSLMIHADVVVTNSFHGTAFSINLNKQFVVFMPSGFGTRINSILELCGLKHRLVNNINETMNVLSNTIDYSPINTILENEREKTYTYIKKALQ